MTRLMKIHIFFISSVLLLLSPFSFARSPSFCHGQSWYKSASDPILVRQKVSALISPNLADFIPHQSLTFMIQISNLPTESSLSTSMTIEYKGFLDTPDNLQFPVLRTPIFINKSGEITSFRFQKLETSKISMQVQFYNSKYEKNGELLLTLMDCE